MVKSAKFDALLRWIQLVAIATGVGGVGFAVLVLFPSMPTVTDETMRGALAGAVFGRFGPSLGRRWRPSRRRESFW